MTEQEWMECDDTEELLKFLQGKVSDRKLQLFITRYCRHHWHLFHEARCRTAIEVAELFADGQVDSSIQAKAYIEVCQIESEMLRAAMGDDWQSAVLTPACLIANASSRAVRPRITTRIIFLAAANTARAVWSATLGDSVWEVENRVQIVFLRDIINPFRPVTLDPKCLTPTVKQIAESIYQERAFDRLPILADTLEESGCTQEDVLKHLRGGGEHVRGCWALDLVTGRE